MSKEDLPKLTNLVSLRPSFGVSNTESNGTEEVVFVIVQPIEKVLPENTIFPKTPDRSMTFQWHLTPKESIALEKKLHTSNDRFKCRRCIGSGKRFYMADPETGDINCPQCNGTGIREKYQ